MAKIRNHALFVKRIPHTQTHTRTHTHKAMQSKCDILYKSLLSVTPTQKQIH